MDQKIKSLIGRLRAFDPHRRVSFSGTAFRVGPHHALTAFHNVGDRGRWLASSEVHLYENLRFEPSGVESQGIGASVVAGCLVPGEDWALLELGGAPADVPIPPFSEVAPGQSPEPDFSAWGFPVASAQSRSGVTVSGVVRDVEANYQGAWAYELYSDEAAAGNASTLDGLSGAPLVVGKAIVGILRVNMIDPRNPTAGVAFGKLYACPIASPTLQALCGAHAALRLDPIAGLPGLPQSNLPRAPFRYLEWFDKGHAEVFFGRSRVVRSLFETATDPDAPPVVLFFGKSGVGKSSVLEAGLFPRLLRDFDVFAQRREQGRTLLETFNDLHEKACRSGRPAMLVLDQIEEVYTEHRTDGDRALGDLARAIRTALDGPCPPIRVLLVFRSEWLPEVRARITEADLAVREVFLERMTSDEVKEVVRGVESTKRLRSFYRVKVDPELPGLVAADVLRDPDSPVTSVLSIVMTRLWERLPSTPDGSRELRADVYQGQMRTRIGIEKFLDEQLVLVAAACPEASASGLIDDVLYAHTTEHNTAAQVGHLDLVRLYAGGQNDAARHAALVNLVAALVRHRLLYPIPSAQRIRVAGGLADAGEPVSGADGVAMDTRLVHDTLAEVIRRHFDASIKPGRRSRRILEARARDWEGNDGSGEPLDRNDLRVVLNGLNGMRARTKIELQVLAVSERAQARARLRRIGAGAAAGLAIAAVIVAFVALGRQDIYKAQGYYTEAVSAMNAKEFLSAQVLLATATTLDDRARTRQLLLDARLRSPQRRSVTRMPENCVRVLAIRQDGTEASCLGRMPPSGASELSLTLYRLDGTSSARNVKLELATSNPEHVRAAFAPDGTLAVFGDDAMRLMTVAPSVPTISESYPIGGRVKVAVICKDVPRFVAMAVVGGQVMMLDVATRQTAPLGSVDTSDVSALAISDACDALAVARDNNVVETWRKDSTGWTPSTGFKRHMDVARSLVFAADGSVVSGSSDASIRAWDPHSGDERIRLEVASDVSLVAMSRSGNRILSKGYDQRIKVWDRRGGRLLSAIREFDDKRGQVVARVDLGVREAGFVDGSDNVIFFRNSASEIEVWNRDGDEESFVLRDPGSVSTLAFHPTKPHLLSGGDDAPDSVVDPKDRRSRLRYWNLESRKMLQLFEEAPSPFLNVRFAAGGAGVVTSGVDGQVLLWSTDTGKRERREVELPSAKWALAVEEQGAEAGRVLIAADPTVQKIALADFMSGKVLKTAGAAELEGADRKDETLSAVAIYRDLRSGDGKVRDLLVTASDRVAFFDITGGAWRALGQFEVGRGVYALAVNPSHSLVAAASSNRYVSLYDIADIDHIRPRENLKWHHDGGVTGVAFCGHWLLSSGGDGTVRFTEAANPTQSFPIQAHDGPAWWVACNHDQTMAASGSTDGSIRVYKLGQIAATLERAPRDLVAEATARSGLVIAAGQIARRPEKP